LNRYVKAFVLGFFLLVSLNFSPVESKKLFVEEIVSTATIAFVGDLMCHSTQFNYAHVQGDSFDFKPVFSEVKKYLELADFAVGNLETVTAGKEKGYSGYPLFNTPSDFVTALKYAGFDLLVTANNHSLDRGEYGVRKTIENILNNGLSYTGTFLSEEDKEKVRVFNLYGISVAIIAYTYGTNGIPLPRGKDYIINLIDDNTFKEDISGARAQGAEIVIVHFHFGEEYKRNPSKYQIENVKKAVEAGADIIIGGHPHVIQPAEFLKGTGGTLDSVFTAYSLGNFISNQRWRYSDAGVILFLTLKKNFKTGEIYLAGVSYLPTWVFRGVIKGKREFVILPAEAAFYDNNYNFLSEDDLQKMRQAFSDTEEMFINLYPAMKLLSVKNIKDRSAYAE
jgi:hypothetical protein